MAGGYGGQLVALDANVEPFDLSNPLAKAAVLKSQSLQNEGAATENQASALKLKMLGREDVSQDIGFRSNLILNAAARALDSDSWDDAMKEAVKNGAPEAGQYIGRYTPILQQRLYDAYSGSLGGAPAAKGQRNQLASAANLGAPGAGAGGVVPMADTGAAGGNGPAGPASLDRQFANATPDQMAQSLSRIDSISDALSQVRDGQSWDAAVQKLVKSGVPQAQQYMGAYSPLRVQQLWNNIQPVRNYLQSRLASKSAGLPDPLIPRNFIKTESGVFEADPYAAPGTPAKSIASTPKFFRTGANDANGRPIVANQFTGETTSSDPVSGDAPGASGIPLTDWATRMQGAENTTGDRSAKNPNSSATGNGQFIDSTWLRTVRAARPELSDLSDAQILKLRSDPAFASEMTAENARSNAQTLANDGNPINSTTLALAHRFGPHAASSLLDASPDAKMSDVLPASVIKANPGLDKQTVGDYVTDLAGRVGTDPVDAGLKTAARTLSPEEKVLREKILPEAYEKAKDSYESAQNLQLQLGNMQDQLNQMGTTGFLAPGTGATERLSFAKKMNSLASVAGIDEKNLPFDTKTVASGEDILKGTTRLGFDLARQLGSREAMTIVQQAVGAVPGLENTPRGARLIFGALNTAAQRQSDYYEYLQRWAHTHSDTEGADVAFNKAMPVQHYVNQALLAAVPPERVQYLKANPKAASDFDAYYGKGLSSVILGKR